MLGAIVLLLAAASPVRQYFTSGDGYRLAYTAEGSGRAMLVIPGGPGLDSAYMRAAVRGLHARAYLVDLRGTGHSNVPENARTITVDKVLSDLERLRKTLHLRRWIVMGHSFGGFLAQAYAARYGNHVRALVLVSSSAPDLALEGEVSKQIASRLTPADRQRLANANAMSRTNPDAAMQTQMDTLLPYFMADRSKWRQIQPYMDPPHNSYAMARALESDLSVNHVAGSLRGLDAPVLVVYGKRDGGVPIFTRAIQQNSANVQVHIVRNAGHFVWLDRPVAYRDTINRFLDAIR